MMTILVTNDDGIEAKGIQALRKGLLELKGVTVITVAPEREKSATSHALTLHRPLRIKNFGKDQYAVDGTPTDSVMMACSMVLKSRPDLIVSGVNRGGNLGDDVHYSGTVSAAIEGGIMGIPAIAVSQLGKSKFDYKLAVKFTQRLVRTVMKNPIPPGIVLNVNVPEGCTSLAYALVKTGKRNYGSPVACVDPRGRPYYWLGGDKYEFEDRPGSDCNAIADGKISVTPLKVNMTDYHFLKTMKKWKWSN